MNIENYREDLKDSILALLGDGKCSSYGAVKQKIWNWLYSDGPFGNTGSSGVVIVDNDSIVGFNGYIPVYLLYNGQIIESKWSIDTVVSARCRGKGYGKKLANHIKSAASIVIGLGISDAQACIMKMIGYRINQDIQRYYYNNRGVGVKLFIKKILQYYFILKNLNKIKTNKNINFIVIPARNMPRNIDRLWNNIQSEYKKTVVKDFSYLNWKYGKHPLNNYQFILANDSDRLVAVGVFINRKRVSRFLDYIGPARDVGIKKALVKVFMNECNASEILECTSTDPEFKKVLEVMGFLKYKEKPRFYIHSNIGSDHDCHMNWFVMGGDSDGDLNPALLDGEIEA